MPGTCDCNGHNSEPNYVQYDGYTFYYSDTYPTCNCQLSNCYFAIHHHDRKYMVYDNIIGILFLTAAKWHIKIVNMWLYLRLLWFMNFFDEMMYYKYLLEGAVSKVPWTTQKLKVPYDGAADW